MNLFKIHLISFYYLHTFDRTKLWICIANNSQDHHYYVSQTWFNQTHIPSYFFLFQDIRKYYIALDIKSTNLCLLVWIEYFLFNLGNVVKAEVRLNNKGTVQMSILPNLENWDPRNLDPENISENHQNELWALYIRIYKNCLKA